MKLNNYFDSPNAQLAVLAKMAKADGKVTGSEKMFLILMAGKMNISNSEFEEIFENAEKFEYIPPIDREGRFVMFYRVIQMMKMDLSVDLEEIEFCKQLGRKLDIDDTKIGDIIKLSIMKNKEVVGYDEIRELLMPNR
ncbi:hypothetical protein [Saccharicrinis sp. 156]|uniref:hypothetical protein n=1 Tax=Saccharicrinis sp. 156 TaxID=3417574 RepID=UPI003D339F20